MIFVIYRYVDHRDLHDLTPTFPTRRSSDLDLSPTIAAVHDAGGLVAVATDLLACTLLIPPGEQGADVCVGSSQRFGVPLGYGGPHARSEEHTSELQSLMRISYAVFCLEKKKRNKKETKRQQQYTQQY